MTTHISVPQKPSSIAIFLNGQREITDEQFVIARAYQHIIVCDGAWNTVQKLFPNIHNVSNVIVLGDGDSIDEKPTDFIQLDCQETTDFEKALLHILSMNGNLKQTIDVDVFWGNGGNLDHTLGNLALATKYTEQVTCHFYSEHQYYRAVTGAVTMDVSSEIVANKTLSIFPFPHCHVLSTQGLKYPMNNYIMSMNTQQSLRNQITDTQVRIDATGTYFIFVKY